MLLITVRGITDAQAAKRTTVIEWHKASAAVVVRCMPNITGVLARVVVEDLEAAIPLYRELAGVPPEAVRRFGFRDVHLARVGPFLLLSGDTAPYADRTATVLVERMDLVIAAVERCGGEILEDSSPAPNGARLIARHPDGAVFEYIEYIEYIDDTASD